MNREREQVRTTPCNLASIMRTKDFRQGVEDKRAGRWPKYDAYTSEPGNDAAADLINHLWHYERGRLFAALAPFDMPIMIGGKLNPKALRLFGAASRRGYIT